MKHIKFPLIFFIVFIGMQSTGFSQYHEGDTLQFWSVTYIDWPPLQGSPQRQVDAICKKAGDHCYVFVEDSIAQPSQADIDSLVHTFDSHFYDSLTSRYGPVPDVFDNDSNIFILVFDESDWAGYFDPGQQMTDSMVYARWNRHSTQREMIYIAASAFSYSAGIVAHEFGHLLHWQQDHSPEPIINPVQYWEDAWVDEGFSTFAAIYLTENIYQHNVLDNSTFFASNPDIPLIYFSNYNQVKLFMSFMYEHYGKWNYISALISNQLNGIKGVDSTLNELSYTASFDDAFEQWVIANFADDSVYAAGKYSYAHYRFSSCYVSANYNTFPTGLVNATVNPYAADYVSFNSMVPKPIVINFDGQSDSKFRIDFILKNTSNNHIDSIISVPLDSLNHATFIADSLGTTYNKVIMVVMNIDSTIDDNNTASYSYSAESYTGIEENEILYSLNVFPNPAENLLHINFSCSTPQHILLTLSTITGQTVHSQKLDSFPGAYSKTIDITGVSKGIYLLKIAGEKGSANKKVVIE